MKTAPFVIEKVLNAPVSRVWKAITNKDDMKQWYFDLAAFKPEVGFTFEFQGGKDDRSYRHLCKITEVVPEKKLTYSWSYDGYPGQSFVSFELRDDSGKTSVKLSHAGLDTFPKENPDFNPANFAEGWTYIIGQSLKTFVEK
ncbi:Uncharacterized conserved protein YndB, AHSA1/START domain [Hydrobacter penzbergensis]|uniref:Uncharacterized conserved protein YndB, AHSA1/START domain n=1 Tax=Hydrobacter penzbergensis TaxID=1235997 RepID=A0A8X8IHY7_9BACT|nr:SRPBCC domain-containing protein [Hydrobacter penzbergensis]SDX50375.1 Uncharacterized conserved protein YndB, AHSA1/START domain [Hydrobacter penzbergensis]